MIWYRKMLLVLAQRKGVPKTVYSNILNQSDLDLSDDIQSLLSFLESKLWPSMRKSKGGQNDFIANLMSSLMSG